MIWVLAAAASASLKLNVNVKDGDKIAGVYVFRVTVESSQLVTQVEFYFGADLRDSDTSTPYEFKIDTVAEAEGPVDVRFVAYTDRGERAERRLRLTIDNEVGKGADFHVDRARELLAESKWDDAIVAGRTALKAKPGYGPARLVMARANFGKGVLDTAQKFAEDVINDDKGNVEARNLLSGIQLRRAFLTVGREGADKAETLNLIREAMKSAIDSRRAVLDEALDALGPVTDANRLQVADAAIRGGRYSRVIDALAGEFRRDPARPEVANRLLYSQIRAGRMRDAVSTMQLYSKGGRMDGVGHALAAMMHSRAGDDAKAMASEREAILADPMNLAVRTAQTWLALRRGNPGIIARMAEDLARDAGDRTEVNTYLAAVYFSTRQLDLSRDSFEKAVLAEPTNYDAFVERAHQSLAIALQAGVEDEAKKAQYAVARAFFQAALTARPESFEALAGAAIAELLDGKIADALRMANAATAAGPEFAGGHFALAAVLAAQNQTAAANRSLLTAARLDAPNLQGRGIPSASEAWLYLYRHGRTPFIAFPVR